MNELLLGMVLAFGSHDTLDLQLVLETKVGAQVRLTWDGMEAVSSSTGAFHRFSPLRAPRNVPLNFVVQIDDQNSQFEIHPLNDSEVTLITYDKRLPGLELEKALVSNFDEFPQSLIAVFFDDLPHKAKRPQVALVLNPLCRNCTEPTLMTTGVLDRVQQVSNFTGLRDELFQFYDIGSKRLLLACGREGFLKAWNHKSESASTSTSRSEERNVDIALIAGVTKENFEKSSDQPNSIAENKFAPRFIVASNYSESRRMYRNLNVSNKEVLLLSNSLGGLSEWSPEQGSEEQPETDLLHYTILHLGESGSTHETRSLHGAKIDFVKAKKASSAGPHNSKQKGLYLLLLSILVSGSIYTGYRIMFGMYKESSNQ